MKDYIQIWEKCDSFLEQLKLYVFDGFDFFYIDNEI